MKLVRAINKCYIYLFLILRNSRWNLASGADDQRRTVRSASLWYVKTDEERDRMQTVAAIASATKEQHQLLQQQQTGGCCMIVDGMEDEQTAAEAESAANRARISLPESLMIDARDEEVVGTEPTGLGLWHSHRPTHSPVGATVRVPCVTDARMNGLTEHFFHPPPARETD